MQHTIKILEQISEPIGNISCLDCQGTTNYLHQVFSERNIEHQVYCGKVINTPDGQIVCPHFWIEIDDLTIDYKLQMWLKIANCPHGIFDKLKYSHIEYSGKPIEIPVLPKAVLEIMAMPIEQLIAITHLQDQD